MWVYDSSMKVNTRSLAKSLRYLPKSEVERYCSECGMDDAQVSAVIDYLYYNVTVDLLCMRFGISRSTFFEHEKVLAIRLLRYMVSIGAIDRIVQEREQASHLVKDLELFGK